MYKIFSHYSTIKTTPKLFAEFLSTIYNILQFIINLNKLLKQEPKQLKPEEDT
jgi:hypothetical protein